MSQDSTQSSVDTMPEQVPVAAAGRPTRYPIGTVQRSKLVAKSNVEYATYGVNHVVGCYHGCEYCYARSLCLRFGRVGSTEEWSSRLAVVENAVEKVRNELSRMRNLPDRVHLSFVGDPFMWDCATGAPVAEVAEVSKGLIQAINEAGVPVTVLTKGVYPELPIGEYDERNQYGITVVSRDESYRATWEPGAPSALARIDGLLALAEQGATTWVSLEPYPTPNIAPDADDVIGLLNTVRFVDKVIFGRMNYVPAADQYVRSFDPGYYERVVENVSFWCYQTATRLHIKSGTPGYLADSVGILDVA